MFLSPQTKLALHFNHIISVAEKGAVVSSLLTVTVSRLFRWGGVPPVTASLQARAVSQVPA